MGMAVLDVDLADPPADFTGLERHAQAFILIRLHGKPVGQTTLPIAAGRLRLADHWDALIQAGGWPLWELWLRNHLQWEPRAYGALPRATIAMCTRDRPDDVARCLPALVDLPDDGQEVLVVDNCPSTDATRQIVTAYPNVRYVREPRPGLNAARNRALREATGEIVAFTDDDAVPDRGWLRGLLTNFHDPLVLCVTGLTMPLELETDAQEWHERYTGFGRGFVRRVFDRTWFNPLAAGQVGSGVNMAVRRSVLEVLGPFDDALDAGTRTCSGGDAEMIARILCAGHRIVYEPHALNWHRHRRTWRELRRMVFGYGVGVYAAWTRSWLVEREVAMLPLAASWLWRKQLPTLVRAAFLRPCSVTLDLILAELRGCLSGPRAYRVSRRQREALPV